MKKFWWIFFALASVFIIFFVYREIPFGHFNWEDAMFLGDAAKVWTSGNLRHIFTPWIKQYVRFFRQPFFVIFYRLFGYNASPYFLFVLILRLFNVFLIYVLADKLTKSTLISFFSSIFYGIYQVNFLPLAWLSSGTKEEPMVFFFLLSLLTFIKYFEGRKKKFLFLSYFFFFICFHCEFKTFAAPLVFLSYEVIFHFQRNKKDFSNIPRLVKYLPFLLLEIYFFLWVYNGSAGMFSGFKNKLFLLTFPASLPLYFFDLERLSSWTLMTKDWGFNPKFSDGVFLIYFGLIILLIILILALFLAIRRKTLKSKILAFLLIGVFINCLPVMLMVLSGQYGIEPVVTARWHYFCLSSCLACIMAVSLIFWLTEEILLLINLSVLPKDKVDQELLFIIKWPTLQMILCLILFNSYYLMDRRMLREFLFSSEQARRFFYTLKKVYPRFAKETVLAIEGAEDDSSPNFFQNRYLFENFFALYAEPNNPDYAEEQKNLPFDGEEAFNRKLERILYYTNVKYFIVGNHQYMYQSGNKISWSTKNLPWSLPTYDREFLGAVYGFFDPQKFVVLSLANKQEDYGSFTDLTLKRSAQIQKFLDYFCFEDGKKKCSGKVLPPVVKDQIIKEIFSDFSSKGKEIFNYLISQPSGLLPDLFTFKI